MRLPHSDRSTLSGDTTIVDRIVLRSTGSAWMFAVLSAFLVLLLGDAVVRGAVVFALAACPWILLVIWGAYMLLVRPCVVVEPSGLTIVNVVRTHWVPWARVSDLRSRFQLTVHTDDGRRIRSWGAPSVGTDRPSMAMAHSRHDAYEQARRASGVRRRTVRATPSLSTSRLIERARDGWESREPFSGYTDVTARVTARPAAVPLVIGVILVALCALQALCPGL